MRSSWNKGLRKESHSSVLQISETMKSRKIDNFKKWRDKAKQKGLIKSEYPALEKNGDLAEFIGVILGDGNIQKFPRTERLLIFSNSTSSGFIKRYTSMTRSMFNKEPYVYKVTGKNCTRISIYESNISARLNVPTGARKNLHFTVPSWISENKDFVVRYLRGLYEAEGSWSTHLPTCTHKLSFANRNQSLLQIVYVEMSKLGFHPSIDATRVQISRKQEVADAIELLQFRKY